MRSTTKVSLIVIGKLRILLGLSIILIISKYNAGINVVTVLLDYLTDYFIRVLLLA